MCRLLQDEPIDYQDCVPNCRDQRLNGPADGSEIVSKNRLRTGHHLIRDRADNFVVNSNILEGYAEHWNGRLKSFKGGKIVSETVRM